METTRLSLGLRARFWLPELQTALPVFPVFLMYDKGLWQFSPQPLKFIHSVKCISVYLKKLLYPFSKRPVLRSH